MKILWIKLESSKIVNLPLQNAFCSISIILSVIEISSLGVPNCSTILYRCLSHTLGPFTRAASLTNHNLLNNALVSDRQRLRSFFFIIATIKHTRFLQKMLVKLLRSIIHSSIDLQLYFKVQIYLQNKFWYRLRSECIIEGKFSTILWISNI